MTANPPQAPTRPPLPQEVHLSDYLIVILRRRRTFLTVFLTIFIGVTLYTLLMKPVYEATATLYVKDDKGSKGVVLGELATLSGNNSIDAEIEIIKSRTIAEQVVKRLHLDWQTRSKQSEVVCKVTDISSVDKHRSFKVELTSPGQFTLSAADGRQLAKGGVGQLLRFEGGTLLINRFSGKPGDTCTISLTPFNEVVAGLRKGVKISEVGKKTNIITIAYRHTDPALASDVVNAMVQAYLDQTVAFNTEEANRTVKFIEEQLAGTRSDLEKAEGDLQGYKSSTGVVKLDTEAEELIKKISDVEKERAAVTLQKKQLEFSLASLRDVDRKGGVYSPAVNNDPLLSGMAARLSELGIQKRALLAENTAEHPQVKSLQAQMDELQNKIRATFETALKNVTKQERDVDKRLVDYEAKLRRLPAAEQDLARYTRIAKVNSDIFTFLLQKHEEARITQAATISNIKIVDPAIVPEAPVKPNKRKNLLLGLMLGLVAGVGLTFFQDYLDDTIKDADTAKREFGFPLLAVIPFIVDGSPEHDADAPALISAREPKSQAAEAFRSLRTNIHFSAFKKENRSILVTSTFPGEGKSTIAANLAISLAQTGVRVLLIDCDMRRPSLHEKFRFNRVPGLTEFLAGDFQLADVIHENGIPNLQLISSGTIPPNPAELLGSQEMENLLRKLKEDYLHIVIDAPPLLAVTDATVLTSFSDLVLLVLEPGRVPVKIAGRVREMLGAVQAPVAGIVVSDRKEVDSAYGYYYGKYGYGSSHDYTDDVVAAPSWWQRFSRAASSGRRKQPPKQS